MDLVRLATRHLFFTGKGGVGKTSVACATAIGLADAGKRVLLVSTDPASNLDEVLGASLGTRPVAIPGVPSLHALNLDPEAAARAYRERVVGLYRELLPPAAVRSMEEQLSGACTVEIAAFDEFARLLGEPAATAEYDHVLFDTAPTGHTLRLLTLPSADRVRGAERVWDEPPRALAGLEKQRVLYDATVKALSDPARTTMVLVARPSLRARGGGATSAELAALGIRNQRLVMNAVFEAHGDDAVATALERRGRDALAAMPDALRALPRTTLPLRPGALLGVDALRRIDRPSAPMARARPPAPSRPCCPSSTRSPRRPGASSSPRERAASGRPRSPPRSPSSWRGAACASTSARPTPPRTSPARSAFLRPGSR